MARLALLLASLGVLLLCQKPYALKCSCRSVVNDDDMPPMLAAFKQDVILPAAPCPASGLCETDDIEAPPTYGGYCWNYTGPFSPVSTAVQWSGCAKFVPVALLGQGCVDLTPFGLVGAMQCTCNDKAGCNSGSGSSLPLTDLPQPTANVPDQVTKPGEMLNSCPAQLLDQVLGEHVQLRYTQASQDQLLFTLQLPTMVQNAFVYFYKEDQTFTKMIEVAVNVSSAQFLSANGQHRLVPLVDPFFQDTPPSLGFWYPICLQLSFGTNLNDGTCELCTFVQPIAADATQLRPSGSFYTQNFFQFSGFTKSSTSISFVVKAAGYVPIIDMHISVLLAEKQLDARCAKPLLSGSFIQQGKLVPNMPTVVTVPILPTDAFAVKLFHIINIPAEWGGPIRKSSSYIPVGADIDVQLNVDPCYYCQPPIAVKKCPV